MKVFHCDHCQQLIFFENIRCVNCDHALAYLPDVEDMAALESADDGLWKTATAATDERTYRLCHNYSEANVCNWAVPAADPNPLCYSCRLTRVIPDLSRPENRGEWYSLEVAKRRLVYNLQGLGLPLANRIDDPERGLAFEFLADPVDPAAPRFLTGYDNGVITINVAEANPAEREKRRVSMREPYRTLLGHFRHEVGHYYWDRLIKDSAIVEGFREQFGDERPDYSAALAAHYQAGPPTDWQENFVSAYASSHPWEDWAETWAHYLHMVDTLETATACGVALRPRRSDEPVLRPTPAPFRGCRSESFDAMIERWFPLTYVLNNLNRGLGLLDGYPFVLSSPAIEKLRFVHDAIGSAASG